MALFKITLKNNLDFMKSKLKFEAENEPLSGTFDRLRGFPDGSVGKESACNAGDLGLMPGLGRSHGEGKGYPLQYSGLEISMDYTV